MILIGGATGQLGTAVVSQLLRQNAGAGFAVLARNSDKARRYVDQGIELRLGDYDAPETLAAAFEGVQKFLFISTMSHDRTAQQKRVVEAARAAGVKHIVYTGLAIQNIETSAVRDLMQSHFDTEAHIRASGMDWTFLRNTMYAEAISQIVGPMALEAGISLSAGAGRVPYALRAEMGEAAANVLLQDGHAGKTYTITGLPSYGYGDIAASLSEITGRNLSYRDIPEEELKAELAALGLPDFMIWLTLGTLRDIRNGQYDIASNDLATLLGRTPMPLKDMLNRVFWPES